MRYGIVMCSTCNREVHQDDGSGRTCHHCEDHTAMCESATAIYPKSTKEIVGKVRSRRRHALLTRQGAFWARLFPTLGKTEAPEPKGAKGLFLVKNSPLHYAACFRLDSRLPT